MLCCVAWKMETKIIVYAIKMILAENLVLVSFYFCPSLFFGVFIITKKKINALTMVLCSNIDEKIHLIECICKNLFEKKISKNETRRFCHMKVHVLHHFFLPRLWYPVTCWTCVLVQSYRIDILQRVYCKRKGQCARHMIRKFDLTALKSIAAILNFLIEHKVLKVRLLHLINFRWIFYPIYTKHIMINVHQLKIDFSSSFI